MAAGVGAQSRDRPRDSAHRKDTELEAAIADVLARSGLGPEGTISAAVEKGYATLTGEVESWSRRDAVERAVRRLPRLRGLTNLVCVKAQTIAREVQQAILQARDSPW